MFTTRTSKLVLASLLALLSAGTSFGQINVKPEYELYEPVEYSLTQSTNSQAIWAVQPLDGQTRFVSKQYGDVYAFWGQPGRYALEATVVTVDFDARTFDIKKYNATFRIGTPSPVPPSPPGPQPGPVPPSPPGPPSPSVPSDEFDNLGQRLSSVCEQAGLQYDLRLRVSEVYQTAATRMTQSGQFYRISDVKAWIESELNKLSLDSSWQVATKLLQEDAAKRAPQSWEQAYKWYRAVAIGYKGGPLNTTAAVWSPLSAFATSPEIICTDGSCYVR